MEPLMVPMELMVMVVPTHHNAPSSISTHVILLSSLVLNELRDFFNGLKVLRIPSSIVTALINFDEVKRLMTEEFCPQNEVKKLEAEFWDLAQDGGESLAYTTRFHKLSLLVPHMVTPLSRCIEKYIGGLPRQIQDIVLRRNPATLEDAIHLSATLTDNHVKAGTLTRKGTKKVPDTTTPPTHIKEDTTEPSRNNKKRKARNYAMVTPAIPVNQAAPMSQSTCRPSQPTKPNQPPSGKSRCSRYCKWACLL
ncbi:hypothetical protein L1987_33678 [Smallanthus sonchifolius]|uniref:Uncharacterized protein n=1 Tax=Smallanthus sonchifolius TaxID=185202 RepID=A0ACB9HSJ0_9ASTR|nr:hypothetical protein L1987_33678 [Smallanthus sonchifolius]